MDLTQSGNLTMTTSTKTQTAANPTLVGQTVALSLISVAPENARFHEPADADIPSLAESILAAGLLINLLVRKGVGKKENTYMALDGRRRLLALNYLLEADLIKPDYQVRIEVKEGDEAIAAAVVVVNTQRRSPHIADTLTAIRAMRERKMSIDKIAKSLCMKPADVRKYELMAMAPKEALDALRANRITMAMLKLISRVPDKNEQARLAQQAMNGYLGEHTVKSLIENKGYSSEAEVIKIIGLDTYVAAKGAVQKDMFEEYAPRCLDEALVQELWRQKVTPLASLLEQKGLTVLYYTDTQPEEPEGLCEAPNINRTEGYQAEDKRLLGLINDQVAIINERDKTLPIDVNLLTDIFEAEYNKAVHDFEGFPLTAVCIHPSDGDSLITTTFYTTEEAYDAFFEARRANVITPTTTTTSGYSPYIQKRDELPARDVKVDVSQQSHAYHMLATNIASRGLQRSISSDYRVSLLLVTSQMFSQTLLNDGNNGEHTRLPTSDRSPPRTLRRTGEGLSI